MDKKEYQREFDRRRHEEAKPAYEALMSCYPLTLDDLDGEEWKDIEGYDGYQVSNYGRIKSFKRKTPLILTPKLSLDYLETNLYKDGKPHFRKIHILVAQAFIPNPENKPQVNHIVGCKFNCYVGNLQWATDSENKQHAYDTGLKKTGEEHGRAKLTNKQALYVRENPDNLTQEQLAEQYGYCLSTICNIVNKG